MEFIKGIAKRLFTFLFGMIVGAIVFGGLIALIYIYE